MFKTIVILLLILVAGSLFSALIFLARDQGRGERAAKALTLRIGLSLLLFLVLMAGFYFGYIQPPSS